MREERAEAVKRQMEADTQAAANAGDEDEVPPLGPSLWLYTLAHAHFFLRPSRYDH